MNVRAGIITGYGINADCELAEAFRQAGAEPKRIHINDIIAFPDNLKHFHILGFSGGFSFGDHISSGLVFANLCKKHLTDELNQFRDEGKLILGICNGFQILVKMGLLPNLSESWQQEVSLVHNDSGLFVDKWIEVKAEPNSCCIWTKGIDLIELPIRHGEGRFIVRDDQFLELMKKEGLVALRYNNENPNGSVDNIAGITDKTGRMFGLMPHPEAYLIPQNHPRWINTKGASSGGTLFFKNAVQYIKNNLII